MKRVFLCAMLAAILICSSIMTVSAEKVPYTQFIQAEDLKIDGSSVSVSSPDGAIGKVLVCEEKAEDAFEDGFTLAFNVPEEGDYTIWCRINYPDQSSNSMFYSVDGDESLIWDMPDEDGDAICYGSWQYFYLTFRENGEFSDTTKYGAWSIEHGEWRHSPNVLHLTAGDHAIHITGRETGWAVDEFIVTNLLVEEYDPNVWGANENKCVLGECKFCGTHWLHYYSDIYAQTGETAEQYYNRVLVPKDEPVKAEPSTADAAIEAAPVAAAPSAPSTADVGIIFAVAAMAAAGVILSKKH